MTDSRPDGDPRPFSARELDGVTEAGQDDLVGDVRTARDLEALAGATRVAPTPDFVDRVMVAVAAEPGPAPVRAARIALRRGALGGLAAAVADAWRVMTRPGFPMAVRAQAFALVLLVAGLFAGSGLATAGAIGLLDRDDGGPSPIPSVVAPSPLTGEPSLSTEAPSEPAEDSTAPQSEEPSESPEPSDDATSGPKGSHEPGDTGETGDAHDGSGSNDGSGARATRTPSPDRTESGDSGDSGDGGDGSTSGTPRPTQTPEPGDTSAPTQTPDATSGDSGSSSGGGSSGSSGG
jgi:uncharacterized membrane protein YgcG